MRKIARKPCRVFLTSAILMLGLVACKNETSSKTTAGKEQNSTEEKLPKPKAPTATGTPRILFVGNSHTDYYISIPKMFAELCSFNNVKMNEDELVEMGISLDEIYKADKDKAEAKFAMTDADGNYYDYVVLQEKTPVALQEADAYKASVKMFIDKIRKNSPGAAVYIYEVMSPADYTTEQSQFEEWHQEMKKNAVATTQGNPNTGIYRVADAIKDAYNGENSYKYNPTGKDGLRHGTNTLHMLNDGGFMASTLLYATLFDKKPNVPEEMTFSKGTGDNDGQGKMPVSKAVSNASALLEIAYKNR